MHKENLTKNLDMIAEHMQYKQPSEFEETHKEKCGVSEFNRPYKIIYDLAEFQLDIITQKQGPAPTIHESRANEAKRANSELFKKSTLSGFDRQLWVRILHLKQRCPKSRASSYSMSTRRT